ncbi:adhesion G protein-coupled receptor L1-like [Branchiostoma floridae x Branchiostoma belcheri]
MTTLHANLIKVAVLVYCLSCFNIVTTKHQPRSARSLRRRRRRTGGSSDASSATDTANPTMQAMANPTMQGMANPTIQGTANPTMQGMANPTMQGMANPTIQAMANPTMQGMANPTIQAMANPTMQGMANPTIQGTATPTMQGMANPTIQGTANPTMQGTANPTMQGMANPTTQRTANPTIQGMANPTMQGMANPTIQGMANPTIQGMANPTIQGMANPRTNCRRINTSKLKQACERTKVIPRCNCTGNGKRSVCMIQCTSQRVQQLENELKKGANPADIISDLAESLVEADMNILGRHVRRSIGLLRSLVEAQERRLNNESQEITREQAVGFAKAMIACGSALLRNHTNLSWKNISEDRWSEEASGILDSSERAGILLARTVPNESHWISEENIVMAIKNGTTGPATFPDLGNSSFWADVKDGITLPRTQHHVISAIYSNIGQYFKPKSVNRTVNSRIISATLVNTTLVNGNSSTRPSIDGNVTIVLEHTEQTFNGSTQCVFWDVFHDNWSGEGCSTAETNTTHTTCECNHLTSFAILVDTTGQHSTIGEQHSFALSVITYIGCIISIVCLFFCICVFLGFGRVRCTRTIIHANLCICLLAAEVVFLAAVDKTENAVVCDAIAILLHYLFLAVFTWMCVEGVELYVLLVKVFNLKMNRLIYYHLAGYGIPAIVTAISAGVNYGLNMEGYGLWNDKPPDMEKRKYCWLSVNNYFIWTFVGPMLIVILVNIGFLAMTMKVIYTQKAHDRSNQSEQGMDFKFWIRVSLALVCILGLTWVFGVLYISSETLVFAYVFTVINSLQGLFIFIFHCLLNEMVQDEIERRFGVRCPCWSKKKRQKTVKRQSRRTARAPQQQEIWLGDFTDTKDSHSSTHGSLQTNMSSEDTLDKLDDEGFVENSIYEDGAGTEGSVDNVIYEAGGPA